MTTDEKLALLRKKNGATQNLSKLRDRKMKKLSEEEKRLMTERFGIDDVIVLTTLEDGIPYVRYVNAYYENGAFYGITYGLSNKMRQIEKNRCSHCWRMVYRPRKRFLLGLVWPKRKQSNGRKAEKRFLNPGLTAATILLRAEHLYPLHPPHRWCSFSPRYEI